MDPTAYIPQWLSEHGTKSFSNAAPIRSQVSVLPGTKTAKCLGLLKAGETWMIFPMCLIKHVFYRYSFVRRTVTLVWTAPRNQWSICSKCTWSRMNLLCFPDLILDWRAVTSRICLAPCNQRSIAANCSKCGSRGLNTFHISELILD